MEAYNQNPQTTNNPNGSTREPSRSGRMLGGLVIIVIGSIFLARQAGADIPGWVISFPTIMIAIGLYIGVRHSFRGFGWLIPIGIGGVFLLNDFFPDAEFHRFIWPVVIILAGVMIMFRPRKRDEHSWGRWDKDMQMTSGEDHLDSTVIFGGVKKNIISKTFKGGEAVTVFGGTEINLTQADVSGNIVLDLTQVFGGTKLIVPPHWKIMSEELVCILGGVEDKRPIMADPNSVDSSKVLIIKGTCIFGGIDIKSF